MLSTLDIINDMIGATGTAPLTSKDVNHPSYRKASSKLKRLNLTIQKKGWWFNKSKRTFKRNTDEEIIVPSTALSADPVDRTSKLLVRGNRMYDPENATYTISGDVEVWYVELWEIQDLPTEAADYLRARAVYEFYRDEEGDGLKLNEYKEERTTAWLEMKAAELRHGDHNFFNGTSYTNYNTPARRLRLPI